MFINHWGHNKKKTPHLQHFPYSGTCTLLLYGQVVAYALKKESEARLQAAILLCVV